MSGLQLRLAWRNLWRHSRRTWLTVTAMVFSNVLLVFMIALQLGSYDMMISNTLRAWSGHVQIQAEGYFDNPKMRNVVPGAVELAARLRSELPGAAVSARAAAFVLASSEERTFGIQVNGVETAWEPAVSSLPGLVRHGFTHFQFEVTVWAATVPGDARAEGGFWVPLDVLGQFVR